MAIPTNLIPINESQISSSIQSLVGVLPTEDIEEIKKYEEINLILPDSLFSGSIDEIRNRTMDKVTQFTTSLPTVPTLPTIPITTVPFPPKVPSFGQIKNYINTKIDRIKRQRQQASVSALKEELNNRKNPFEYRQQLRNQIRPNTVLGRYNNQ